MNRRPRARGAWRREANDASTKKRSRRCVQLLWDASNLFACDVDRDGHDVAGIRSVDVAVPVGTNTGWNLYPSGPRERDLCGLSGSFFSFAKTRTERLANGDSRRSLEERYGDHDGFVQAVRRAAEDSVAQRILLQEDAEIVIRMAQNSDILR